MAMKFFTPKKGSHQHGEVMWCINEDVSLRNKDVYIYLCYRSFYSLLPGTLRCSKDRNLCLGTIKGIDSPYEELTSLSLFLDKCVPEAVNECTLPYIKEFLIQCAEKA